MVLIDQLPVHTIEELCRLLDTFPTLGWKRLMRQGFDCYNDDDIPYIKSSKQLLDDLQRRDKPVKDLIDALRRIKNGKAVTVIYRGMKEVALPIQESGGCSRGRFKQPVEGIEREPTSHLMMKGCAEEVETTTEEQGMTEGGDPITENGCWPPGRYRQPVQCTERPQPTMVERRGEQSETLPHPLMKDGLSCSDILKTVLMGTIEKLMPGRVKP